MLQVILSVYLCDFSSKVKILSQICKRKEKKKDQLYLFLKSWICQKHKLMEVTS